MFSKLDYFGQSRVASALIKTLESFSKRGEPDMKNIRAVKEVDTSKVVSVELTIDELIDDGWQLFNYHVLEDRRIYIMVKYV